MRIIEIAVLSNGAHRNQTVDFNTIPDGWAIIPDNISIPNTFPFVNIEVKGNTVVSMTSGIVPEITPTPRIPTIQDDIDSMLVDLDYRVTLLELGISEEV